LELALTRRLLFSLVVTFFLVPISAWAQFAQRGGIEGTVRDLAGSVVPGAQIALLDIAQNQSRRIKADNEGHFEFRNLTAGQYQLTASLQGFETEKSEPITVNIGVNTQYDFKLHPGAVAQTITVTDQEGGLETDRANLSTDISPQQLEDLPVNGRTFTAVADLAPGVSTTPQLNINPGGTYAVGAMFAMGGTNFTTGGAFQGSRDNGFYINGVNINENYVSSIGFSPSVEALATGVVKVADYSTANGHDLSALTMQTKRGSSRFHGEGYDFMENTDLNAVNPYLNALSETLLGIPPTKQVIIRNQFGGGVGGPIFIPKLWPDLKKRLFFFANYENAIEHDGAVSNFGSVPSVAERAGDFSELLTSPVPIQLYNPFFTTYDSSGRSSRPPIPGNRLDLARRPDGSPLIDPASTKIISALWPTPNIPNEPSNESNYQYVEQEGFSNYHVDTRFDATLTSNDSLFVTWSRSKGQNTITGAPPPDTLYAGEALDRSWLVTGNYVHIFSPRLTNELILGFGNGYLQMFTPSQYAWLNSSSNPFNQLFQNTGTGMNEGVFSVFAGSYLSPGYDGTFGDNNRTSQVSDNVDWELGRHLLTAGFSYLNKGEYDWYMYRSVTFGPYNGWAPGGYTGAPGVFSGGAALQGYTPGDPIAELEMGVPSNMDQRFNFPGGGTAPQFWIQFPAWGIYLEDKFRVNQKLTVTAGLRYELNIPAYSPNKNCCGVYFPTTDGGILKVPGIAQGLPEHNLSAPKRDFAPRLSIAYSLNPRTVIRAGFGIFFDAGSTQIGDTIQISQDAVPGFTVGTVYDNQTLGVPIDTPAMSLANIFPAATNVSPGDYPVSTAPGEGYFGDGQLTSIAYRDQNSVPLPYYQRMMLDVQRQVGAHDSITISYQGVQGRKGTNEVNINLAPYQTGWSTATDAYDAARPNNFGRFGDIYVNRPVLNSFYNAGIAQYRHDFTNGFQFMSNYTFGKTVSDYPWSNYLSGAALSGNGFTGFQYPNLYDRGQSSLSHHHRFVYSGIWSPRYGEKWPAWAKASLTGWRISGTGTLESGDNETIINAQTSALDHAGFDEMNVSGDANLSHGARTFTRQFDTSKFSLPPEGVRGNSGLGTVVNPGQNNLDLSVAKTFAIYESLHLEFRADAFNALNHTQWNGMETTYPQGTGTLGTVPFGEVTGAREARIGQLAAKLVF
jgi:hypothetical protein